MCFSLESEKSTESLVSEAWEWREGRLFAYELILKLLITNHIHYLFPSFVLPTAHARAIASVDENLMGRLVTVFHAFSGHNDTS